MWKVKKWSSRSKRNTHTQIHKHTQTRNLINTFRHTLIRIERLSLLLQEPLEAKLNVDFQGLSAYMCVMVYVWRVWRVTRGDDGAWVSASTHTHAHTPTLAYMSNGWLFIGKKMKWQATAHTLTLAHTHTHTHAYGTDSSFIASLWSVCRRSATQS